ncbi:arylsulfatase precursor [Xylariaceae sp. FL0804]|nr:arylsulfatase precursor [Xylariaceae sp. FL0804]
MLATLKGVVAPCLAALALTNAGLASAASKKPNFVLIMTDDQDSLMDSLSYQPAVQQHFMEQGTTFDNHFCTVALCCPSRVSFLTGRAAHNTNVTDVSAPYGGYTKFTSGGWNDNYLPLWLQAEGYNTYYTGKLMNGHSTTTYDSPFAKGWTANDFFLDPNTYIYYNVTMQHDHDAPITYPGNYSTDMASDNAVRYIDDAVSKDEPFFIGVAPIGPHAQTIGSSFTPPVPAVRHQDLFPGLQVPRTANFNPDVASGGSWISQLPQLNETVVAYGDNWYRARAQSLQAVDDLVDAVVSRLSQHPDVLDNTYLIYTADNGYHISQHRLPPGKTCPIEEDYRVPFIMRGPGIEKGKTVSFPSSHTDVVPTIFTLAGIPLQDGFDGAPIPVTADEQKAMTDRVEHINLEFWGDPVPEGIYGSYIGSQNNTYKSVRVVAEDYNLAYTVWCNNDHELYDMKHDPTQLHNLYGTNGTVSGWPVHALTARIDALVLTLKACKGVVCTKPWETLHPRGNVHDLAQAMNPKYDFFYLKQQPKVTYTACQKGYLAEYEGVLYPVPYTGPS